MFGKKLIGLDIGTHAVKVVEVVPRRDILTVTKMGIAEFPEAILVEGKVADPKKAANFIRAAIRQAGIGAGRVYTALSGQGAVVRSLKLPMMPTDEVREAVKWELEGQIPYSLDEVSIRHYARPRIQEGEADGQMEVIAVCALQSNVDALIETLEAARIRPAGIDLTPFSLARAYLHSRVSNLERGSEVGLAEAAAAVESIADGTSVAPGPVSPELPPVDMLVDIGHSQTTIAIVEGAVPLFVRTVALGGEQIDASLEGNDLTAGADALDSLFLEIRRSHDYFRVQNQWQDRVDRVILAGGGALVPGMPSRLFEEVEVQRVEVLNPMANFAVSGRISAELREKAVVFGVALGLTIGGEENGQG